MISQREFVAVVGVLGSALLVSLLLIGGLTLHGDTPPSVFEYVVSGSITGLVGLLVQRQPNQPEQPQPVVVQQPAGQPVPVDQMPDPAPGVPAAPAPERPVRTVRSRRSQP